jgi:hypothetical protein
MALAVAASVVSAALLNVISSTSLGKVSHPALD